MLDVMAQNYFLLCRDHVGEPKRKMRLRVCAPPVIASQMVICMFSHNSRNICAGGRVDVHPLPDSLDNQGSGS